MRWLVRGEPSVPAGSGWLAEPELARAAGMRFTKRRTEYLLRRYAGKAAVAAVVGLPDDPVTLGRIAVLNAPTGAPYATVDGTRIGMDVSLTDRAGWAVCLVGSDLGAVGCDLEIVEPRSNGFVADFLTPAEQQLVLTAARRDPSAGDALANLIWSAKESALKVLRTGLRADTRTVEVLVGEAGQISAAGQGPAPGWHPLAVDTVIGRLPGWWRRDGDFVLTVVVGARGGDPAADAGAPPQELPGSAPLAQAWPIESWRAKPVAD
jgi:4'-phosphopantetheinyl transferase